MRCSKKSELSELISAVVISKLNNLVTKKMSGYGRGRHRQKVDTVKVTVKWNKTMSVVVKNLHRTTVNLYQV